MFRRKRQFGGDDPPDRKGSKKPPRRNSQPLWQPKSERRDVNLEMTPDDLDRSASTRYGRGGADVQGKPPAGTNPPESPDIPGLGAAWRERIMLPTPPPP